MKPNTIVQSLPPNATHQVLNQSGRTPDHDAYGADVTLRGVTARYDLGWAEDRFSRLGEVAGSQEVEDLARQANRHDPELVVFDRYGHRVDEVEFHPAYHALMRLAYGHEVHSLAWTGDGAHPHTARAVLSYLWNQAENGVGCPTGMTYASVDTLRKEPHLRDPWVGKALSTEYDPRPVHVSRKTGITLGMAMTEKQGGSDLKKVRTIARPLDGSSAPGTRFALTGHKWFTSVPMSDAFLAVARTDAGVSCFLCERWHEDGTRNGMRIQRLKDKAGNRSNASSEIELVDCVATLVGEDGHGLRAILEAAHLTRLDFAVGSAGLMRKALTHTLHHTMNRLAFDRPLSQLPMMESILADTALEVEAAALLGFRFTAATDRSGDDEHERLLARVGAPLAKYWNCKRVVAVVAELLECHGGNGFIEEGPMARLYREAPLNAIWEGTSNMMCLDVLRSIRREPDTTEVLLAELRASSGADSRLDDEIEAVTAMLTSGDDLEPVARLLVERLAVLLQATLMLDAAPTAVSESFLATRLGPRRGQQVGAVAPDARHREVVERAAVTA